MLGPVPVRCRVCGGVLPAGEVGWNRARRCPACRDHALARHALALDAPPDDEEEDDPCR